MNYKPVKQLKRMTAVVLYKLLFLYLYGVLFFLFVFTNKNVFVIHKQRYICANFAVYMIPESADLCQAVHLAYFCRCFNPIQLDRGNELLGFVPWKFLGQSTSNLMFADFIFTFLIVFVRPKKFLDPNSNREHNQILIICFLSHY